jgi:hypothetical protein
MMRDISLQYPYQFEGAGRGEGQNAMQEGMGVTLQQQVAVHSLQ